MSDRDLLRGIRDDETWDEYTKRCQEERLQAKIRRIKREMEEEDKKII